jgi:hypothetical protein
MKRMVVFVAIFCMVAVAASAQTFTFSGTTKGGTGSALMDFVLSGNTLTITLDNTSPIYYTDNGNQQFNTPGITGFGFDLNNTLLPAIVSWQLEAFGGDKTGVIVGGASSTGDWGMGSTMAGVSLDYFPQTSGQNIQGALYNPLALGGFSALPNYFTTAELRMTFSATPVIDFHDGKSPSPFVRMQNVGAGGSLKLPGTQVPEPSTLMLLGVGLIGLALGTRKRMSRKAR